MAINPVRCTEDNRERLKVQVKKKKGPPLVAAILSFCASSQ